MLDKGWKRHFDSKMFFLEHDEPGRFVHGPWRRKPQVSIIFLVYRIVIALALLGITFWSMVTNWKAGKWFIYLTHWGFMLITLQAIVAAILVVMAFRRQRNVTDKCTSLDLTGDDRMPASYKAYWVFYNMAIPISFFITVIYWVFLYKPDRESDGPVVLNFMVHAGNATAALLELMFGGPPSRFLHVLHPIAFGTGYLVFNVIYWAAGGTDPTGQTWIYDIVDWEQDPSKAGILVVGSAVLITFLHTFVTMMAGLRSYVLKRFSGPNPRNSIWNTQPTGTYNKGFIIDA